MVIAITHRDDFFNSACILIGYFGVAEFHLREPLGDRSVWYEVDHPSGVREIANVGDAPPRWLERVNADLVTR